MSSSPISSTRRSRPAFWASLAALTLAAAALSLLAGSVALSPGQVGLHVYSFNDIRYRISTLQLDTNISKHNV